MHRSPIVLFFPLLISCASLDVEPITASSPGGGPAPQVADLAALHMLASIRCSREATCDNIGPGGSFANRGECFDATRQLGLAALRRASCGEALEQEQIRECALELRNHSCFVSIADLGRLPACRPERLCSAASPGGAREPTASRE